MGQTSREIGATTVVDHIAETIRDGIMEGRFAPGQRLIEADMTERLGVSRGPLREALRRLSADGLIEIQPYRGAAVRRPSRQDLEDLFRIRGLLEGLAARQAAEGIEQPGRRDSASEMLATMQRIPPTEDAANHVEENNRFHAFILTLASSVTLTRMVGQLQMPSYRLEFFRLFSKDYTRRSHAEHSRILEAILNSDGAAAEHCMREHVAAAAELARNLPSSLFRN